MSFTINYSGDGKGVVYNYKCTQCNGIHKETHSMNEEPSILCPECQAPCKIVVLTAPALDADHHYWMKTDNIGTQNNA